MPSATHGTGHTSAVPVPCVTHTPRFAPVLLKHGGREREQARERERERPRRQAHQPRQAKAVRAALAREGFLLGGAIAASRDVASRLHSTADGSVVTTV